MRIARKFLEKGYKKSDIYIGMKETNLYAQFWIFGYVFWVNVFPPPLLTTVDDSQIKRRAVK